MSIIYGAREASSYKKRGGNTSFGKAGSHAASRAEHRRVPSFWLLQRSYTVTRRFVPFALHSLSDAREARLTINQVAICVFRKAALHPAFGAENSQEHQSWCLSLLIYRRAPFHSHFILGRTCARSPWHPALRIHAMSYRIRRLYSIALYFFAHPPK
jgi:hypothetical protein